MNLASVLVVYKRTAYERLNEEERDPQVLQLLSESHFTVQDLIKAHQEHREAMERVGTALESLKLQYRFVRRADLRDTLEHDLVLALGGDGTFLDVSHHVRDRPMLGVNSSPSQVTCAFCPFTGKTVKAALGDALAGKLKPKVLNRVGLVVDGNALVEPVLSRLLVSGQTPASPARYVLEVGRKREHQRSFGLYVAPAADSAPVVRAAGGWQQPLTSKKVQYVVREPHPESGARHTLLRGLVSAKSGLRVHSKMSHGMLYIDGAQVRYRFDFGHELHVVPEFLPLPVLGLKSTG